MKNSVEILTIGDELLRGELIDSNANWLASQFHQLGYRVRRIGSVGDAMESLTVAFNEAIGRGGLIVATGGLGPTDDDRTAAAVAAAVGVELQLDDEALDHIRVLFRRAGYPFTANNEKQAWFPHGARLLANHHGTAPGFVLSTGDCQVVCMPGVPREMKPMFSGEVVAWLQSRVNLSPPLVRTFKVFGLGESQIDHRLTNLLSLADDNRYEISLHYRTSFPENSVILVVRPLGEGSVSAAEGALATLEGEIRQRLGPSLYGTGSQSLSQAVVQALKQQGATVALAESCTGGLVGHLLTEAPGSSEVFQLGVVAYANPVKHQLLGVPLEILEQHGAVSRPCVEAMARGVRQLAGATYGVAVSGIAGPAGGTSAKPVGTVHFALATADQLRHISRRFPFDRQRIKQVAAYVALTLVLRQATQGFAADQDPLEGRWALDRNGDD